MEYYHSLSSISPTGDTLRNFSTCDAPPNNQFMNKIKILFFLSTEKWGVLASCFVLCSFLIPLSIALGASAKTDLTSEIDHFNVFPYDPFPSSTVCFTNWSMLEQENRWENLTEPFSQRLDKVKRMRLKN